MSTYSVISSIGLTLIVCFIIIPLLSKQGQTIAKKIFKLEVRSIKEDKEPSKMQILLREAFYVGVVVVLSLFTSGIPMVLSVMFLLLNKHNLSLQDYVSGTYVKDTVITLNEEERPYDENIIDVEAREVNK